jgi:hypothetical protein
MLPFALCHTPLTPLQSLSLSLYIYIDIVG